MFQKTFSNHRNQLGDHQVAMQAAALFFTLFYNQIELQSRIVPHGLHASVLQAVNFVHDAM